MVPSENTLTIYNRLDKLPHFNPDIDEDLAFQEVENFRHNLKTAEVVIISTPEDAKGIPGF
jgi:NAD(P)H-dependent FMN reductase